ncbi:MAG TPA: hypothetical protein VFO38_00495 [Candidatus Saccharimonadales bacterium]|nr:hypothetical protein [Candidatus Saccharimonadales bacterium]
MNSQPEQKKLSPILITVIAIIFMCVAYLGYTVATPLFIGDGLNNFSGVKKEAALRSVDYSSRYLDNKTRFLFRYYVNEVRVTSPDEVEKYCKPVGGQETADINDTRHYTTTMTVSELFSLTRRTVIIDGCTAFGSHGDGPYISR